MKAFGETGGHCAINGFQMKEELTAIDEFRQYAEFRIEVCYQCRREIVNNEKPRTMAT